MTPTLAPLDPGDAHRVAHIRVRAEQEKYSGQVADILAGQDAQVDPHMILMGENPVGLFRIDRDYGARHDFAGPGDLGLRGFLIDAAMQGRGLAQSAVRALPAYMSGRYPNASAVVLTVNCENPAAIVCYLKGGFDDTGTLYHGGPAGPQHIFRRALGVASAAPEGRDWQKSP